MNYNCVSKIPVCQKLCEPYIEPGDFFRMRKHCVMMALQRKIMRAQAKRDLPKIVRKFRSGG